MLSPFVASSNDGGFADENDNAKTVEMNTNLCATVQNIHSQLAQQLDLVNNLLAQWVSLQRVSSTGSSSKSAALPYARLRITQRHANWPDRLNNRLTISLDDAFEKLRQLSTVYLPKLARQFDHVQAQNDIDALFKDFELAITVDTSRAHSSILSRYQFEEDDRALVAAHLRRLSARLDTELELATSVIAFENNVGGKLKGSSAGDQKGVKNNKNTLAVAISLEPDLMLDERSTILGINAGGSADAGGWVARPEWPVELALRRLRAGGKQAF